jgi:hypothetical protein
VQQQRRQRHQLSSSKGSQPLEGPPQYPSWQQQLAQQQQQGQPHQQARKVVVCQQQALSVAAEAAAPLIMCSIQGSLPVRVAGHQQSQQTSPQFQD